MLTFSFCCLIYGNYYRLTKTSKVSRASQTNCGPAKPDFGWPDWPDFGWPDWPDFGWPDWPDFGWPDWPDFGWPDWPAKEKVKLDP